jgi:hypothetical protein
MTFIKGSWSTCVLTLLGFLLGVLTFRTTPVKAQAGASVTIQIVKDVRDRITIQTDGSQIVGFSCQNNTSGMGNKCYVASVK